MSADSIFASSVDRRERLLLVIAAIWLLINIAGLIITRGEWRALWWYVLWVACAIGGHVMLRRLSTRDPLLFPIGMLLSGWGLLIIGRTAPNFAPRQPIWLIIALVAFMVLVALPDALALLYRYRFALLVSGFVLLGLMVLSGSNPSGFGPRLWIGLLFGTNCPPFAGTPDSGLPFAPLACDLDAYFQPSEALKIILPVFLAGILASVAKAATGTRLLWRQRARQYAVGGMGITAWLVCIGALGYQRDFGTAALFFTVLVVTLAWFTRRSWILIGGLSLLLIVGIGAYRVSDVVKTRVDIWANPFADPNDSAFQIVQSLLAFSSGGLFGQGIGQGSPTYVPVAHSDFALAAIAEEYGLLGTLIVLVLIGLLVWRGLRSPSDEDPFRQALRVMLSLLMGLQTVLIAGGVVKLIPLTGVTLPFISYGGSSLLITFMQLALLIRLGVPATQVEQAPLDYPHFSGTSIPVASSRVIRRGLSAMLIAVALYAAYWSLPPAGSALASGQFNPRLVEDERAIRRGTITDRHGVVLVESVPVAVSRSGQAVMVRRYARIEAAPAVGYYSLRYGVGGVERAYDPELRGSRTWFATTIHQPQSGIALQTTLDVELQLGLARAFGTRRGAAIVLDAHSGAVRALVSAPGFNPNTLDAQYLGLVSNPGAPLFNRALSANYQPGGVLRPLLWAGMLKVDQSADSPPGLHDFALPVDQITTAQRAAILDVMRDVTIFSPDTLPRYPVAAPLRIPNTLSDRDLAGQGMLTVTPLTMAGIMAALDSGNHVAPYLVESPPDSVSVPIFSAAMRQAIRSGFTSNGQSGNYYYIASAQVGTGFNIWIIGAITTDQGERLVIAAVVEGVDQRVVQAMFVGGGAFF